MTKAELCGTPACRDGQKDEELILSSSDQEVGVNQGRASWEPAGTFHYHESYSRLQVR